MQLCSHFQLHLGELHQAVAGAIGATAWPHERNVVAAARAACHLGCIHGSLGAPVVWAVCFRAQRNKKQHKWSA